jgi:hypothetical protein
MTDEFYQVSVCFPDGWWSAANMCYEWYVHNVWKIPSLVL